MIESACDFGEQNHLKGIFCLPTSPIDKCVVLVSAGLLAKPGPFRLYTELSRRLLSHGVATLRFDLESIGDSELLYPGTPLAERTRRDIADAVELVASELSPRTILLGGLCSGGEDSLMYAETDDRVKGIFMIDPHAYRT